MVFSSIPTYLHHPFNSEQQPQLQQQLVQQNYPIFHHGSSSINPNNTNNQLLPPPPPPPNTTGLMGRIGPVFITGSISEAPFKCPRCESTNTKFGYYNNRSLSQPRHFCKNCRRHWTLGGGLRKVPVGGVRRKNKRPKSSPSSKSAATSTPGASSALIRTTTDRQDFGGTVGVLGLNSRFSENGSDIHFSGSNMPDNRFPFMGGSLYGAEELSNFEFGHVIGSNGLEDNNIANYIGHEDKFGYPN